MTDATRAPTKIQIQLEKARNEGAALHITRGRGGREKKQASARWGVCKATTGASPVTLKRLLHSRFASATHYKTEIFVDGTRADAIDLPDCQIFIRMSAISASRLKPGARCRRQIDRPQIFMARLKKISKFAV